MNKKGTRVLILNHIKNLTKSKRSVSIIIGYVLLVVIAISLALMVYVWLKNYLPGVSEECPDSASLMILDYSCSDNNINIKFRNNGLFNIYGFIARIREEEEGFFYELKTGESVENYFTISPYEGGLKPNEEENILLSFTSHPRIVELQVQPFVLGEKGKPVLCENIITQRIKDCEGSGGNELILGSDKLVINSVWDDDEITGISYGKKSSQLKWDISVIPSGILIQTAELCLYWFHNTLTDNDIRVWRVKYDWPEPFNQTSVYGYNTWPLSEQTDEIISSIAENTYGCFNIKTQLKASINDGENYFTVRIQDPDYGILEAKQWEANLIDIGEKTFTIDRYAIAENRMNTMGTGNKPYIRIYA